ncbi:MAG: hypothetical protein EAZ89_10750 [Bacteroidetes bacterium]|nr:MAG: hypothetical protein EAZ89_10750 [Bacteroidota bacterium]
MIQAEHLKGHRRTVLEKFLSIFDQSAQSDTRGHILALSEDDFPEAYRPVIRRLHKALQNPNIEEEMDLEDEVLSEFHKKDELLAAALQREEEEKRRADEEKLRADEALQRVDEERRTKNALIRRLHSLGLDIAGIARDTGMDEAEVRQVVEGD